MRMMEGNKKDEKKKKGVSFHFAFFIYICTPIYIYIREEEIYSVYSHLSYTRYVFLGVTV